MSSSAGCAPGAPRKAGGARRANPGPKPREPREPVRVLVVDDHAVVRYGVISVLEAEPDIEVVGEASTCAEACAKALALQPGVVVLDLEMDDACGAEALERLRREAPGLRIIVLTSYTNDWRVTETVRVGLDGFLKKDAAPEKIVEAVRAVSAGRSYLDNCVASIVMGAVGRRSDRRRSAARRLSARESSVLQLLVQGLSNKQISAKLNISERTVKFHLSSIFGKLQASNRTEAVKIAIEEGLVNAAAPCPAE